MSSKIKVFNGFALFMLKSQETIYMQLFQGEGVFILIAYKI